MSIFSYFGADLLEQDDSIVSLVKSGIPFEPETLAEWLLLTAQGGTVVDVGCYTGLFSIIAARNCDVIAFEPMPKNHARCLENFGVNAVDVDLRHACATNKDGPTELKYNPAVQFLTSGASLLYPSGGSESTPYRIDGVTIDSLDLDECLAIKMDVERGEPLVLEGARDTLRRCKPMLFVEVLGPEEGRAVMAAIQDTCARYIHAKTLDDRNWVLTPE